MSSSSSYQLLYYTIGLLLLFHSGYSSFEFHKLTTISHHSTSLPYDIIIESIVGIIIIIIGSIISIENQPFLTIDNEVVSSDAKYLKFIEMKQSVQLSEKVGINDYEELNSRLPFVNIIKKRQEYHDWIKCQ
ncbi:uncharacterized protein J8A68_003671 [[Candida] subhashii]|uniref:Membrane magnesium transporter n=1 Tax=[Candida] subhashii TaxID=561895 RepID=A0A8J5QGW7_9ASCO|nr:uncharacterized protein J8A68_003671 [[Candida] subhashii]KAG7662817.1 hypothetical protein J8A68_003671 [[Candida] subhashii]